MRWLLAFVCAQSIMGTPDFTGDMFLIRRDSVMLIIINVVFDKNIILATFSFVKR